MVLWSNLAILFWIRAVESAGMLSKESGDLNKAVDLIEQASTMYLEHGTPDTAAIVLDRAAK